jgi:hypothetical protein
MVRYLNNLTGVVNKIFKNKSKIEVLLSKGGKIIANNEGFNIGDEVCLNITSDGYIIKVISKLVADVTTKVGINHLLETSIREPPLPTEEDDSNENEYEYESEEEIIIGGDNGERECVFNVKPVE